MKKVGLSIDESDVSYSVSHNFHSNFSDRPTCTTSPSSTCKNIRSYLCKKCQNSCLIVKKVPNLDYKKKINIWLVSVEFAIRIRYLEWRSIVPH